MMTGYGYNSNLVQQPPVLQGVGEEWGQVAGQSQYFHTESGTTGLTNPMFYGSMNGWHPSANFTLPPGVVDPRLIPHQNPDTGVHVLPHHLTMMHANLAPAPLPRVSISDEELYQALNMSPLPAPNYQNVQPQQIQPQHIQMQQIQPHLQTDFLTSEICFPSTSTYDSSGYQGQSYAPPSSAGPPEDTPNYQYGHDGDDEESFGEPERFETMSPTFSIHSFAPTTSTNTAEAEDLEVELINNQKPTPRYHLNDDIDIFLHTGTTDDTEYHDDSDSRPTTTYSQRSTKAPTPPASRPAYAQKLIAAAQHQKPDSSSDGASPLSKTSPLYLHTAVQDPTGFTPLLTPNSDALLQKKLSEAVQNPPPRTSGLAAFPAFPPQQPPPPPPQFNKFQENQKYPSAPEPVPGRRSPCEGFWPRRIVTRDYENNLLPILLEAFTPIPGPLRPITDQFTPIDIPDLHLKEGYFETADNDLPPPLIKGTRLSDLELESESQKLAIDVISNLFTNKKEIVDRAKVINAPKKPVARNLFCHDKESLEKAKSGEPIVMNVLDDWETADDEDLTGRMENLLKDVKKEEQKMQSAALSKAALATTAQRNPDWDPTFLQHVLEIYGVPDYKMQEDVIKAMESIGNGDCKVMWMERKVVFAVFESVQRAKNCLTLCKHDWLRFRSLADSPQTVQDSAKTNASSLSLPKKKQQTTATVARRMVENALGKKATVSTEKRQEERNQLAAARAAKKNTVQWD